MPELPEVEIIVRRIRKVFLGSVVSDIVLPSKRAISSMGKLRQRLVGQRLEDVLRRGKAMVLKIGQGFLIVHLRLNGQVCIVRDMPRYCIFGMLFEEKEYNLYICDFRGLAQVKWVEDIDEEEFIKGLGPDVLYDDLPFDYFYDRLKRNRGSIKTLLMDQRFISGIGNIYAVEALFRAGISPHRPASSLSREEAKRLHRAVKEVISLAVKRAAVPEKYLKDDSHSPAKKASWEFFVYGREGQECRVCGGKIKKMKIAGRGTYFCPNCQV